MHRLVAEYPKNLGYELPLRFGRESQGAIDTFGVKSLQEEVGGLVSHGAGLVDHGVGLVVRGAGLVD